MNPNIPPTPPVTVLVVDDEPQILRLLTISLEDAGYRVTTADCGMRGLAIAAQKRHDAIVLDLGLPDVNGIEVLRRLREWTQIPIVILTVQDGEAEKIEALDSGADDYVTKPFNTGELLARLRASLRRANKGPAEEPVFKFGDVEVDLAARRVMRSGTQIALTATEYNLLKLFVKHAGKVLTHHHILQDIWGPDNQGQMAYLRVYMLRLREKLEVDSSKPKYFVTEPGVGYRLTTG